jgi:hypothetical protein
MDNTFNTDNGGAFVPPFHSKPMAWRKGWSKKLRIGKLYFYVSNVRMKKRQVRDLTYTNHAQEHVVNNKAKLYERQEGVCPHCGQEFALEDMELHHVLPLSRFPELGQSIRNSIVLCRRCHKEVHCNPWLNIQMMEEKAKEMNIDLKEHYQF